MTSRCRTLVVMAALGLVLGILRQQTALALVSLSMLVWILAAAIYFYARVGFFWRHVQCVRTVHQHDSGPRKILWVDRLYTMRIKIQPTRGWVPAIAVARDLIPETLSVPHSLNPTTSIDRKLINDARATEITYQCQPLAAGQARFFGIHFQFQDPQGLFLHERVFHEDRSFRILPAYAEVGDPTPRIKRVNALPQHGIHQLRRAGFGGDLLELREYQTGDPPKSIAWKVSARRDRLMTRQYESEVPVRLTIFIDAAQSVYAGLPGRRLIDQSNFLGASVAKAATSVGDAVGLVLCHDEEVFRLRPGHGDRAFYQILSSIADASKPTKIPNGPFRQELSDLATEVARERFPELFHTKLNRANISFLIVRPRTRKRRRNRIELANVFCELYDLDALETAELIYDDEMFAAMNRRFLTDCDRAWVPPVFENPSVETLAPKVGACCRQMAEQLTLSVAHAQDNEVYLLLVNLLDNRLIDPHQEFETLLPAVKIAIARHHRVIVVAGSTTNRRPGRHLEPELPTSSTDVLERAEVVRISRLSQQFARRLRSVGANFAVNGSSDVVKLVMAEAELAGTGRSMGSGRR